jgi:hypothetical protein
MSASRLNGLQFHCFGNEVKGGYGVARRLEMGGVGIIGELPTGTEELSWEDIEAIVEFKRTVMQMVHQSGMHTVLVS